MNPGARALRVAAYLLPAVLVFSPDLSAFRDDSWLVAADRVRVRSVPSVQGGVVAVVNTGTVVRVVKKSDTRDRFLPGDAYGFHWYQAEVSGGTKGWIYGKFLYRMNGTGFRLADGPFQTVLIMGGKRFRFGVAEEEAYPPMDADGLTGSVVHGLPFVLAEGAGAALLFRTETVRTFQDGDRELPYYFGIEDGEGGIQKIKSVAVESKGNASVLRMTVDFTTQTGGGEFSITAVPAKGCMLITGYKMEKEFEF